MLSRRELAFNTSSKDFSVISLMSSCHYLRAWHEQRLQDLSTLECTCYTFLKCLYIFWAVVVCLFLFFGWISWSTRGCYRIFLLVSGMTGTAFEQKTDCWGKSHDFHVYDCYFCSQTRSITIIWLCELYSFVWKTCFSFSTSNHPEEELILVAV